MVDKEYSVFAPTLEGLSFLYEKDLSSQYVLTSLI